MSWGQFGTGAWNFVGTLTRTAAWAVSTTVSSVTYSISVVTGSTTKIQTQTATFQNYAAANQTSAELRCSKLDSTAFGQVQAGSSYSEVLFTNPSSSAATRFRAAETYAYTSLANSTGYGETTQSLAQGQWTNTQQSTDDNTLTIKEYANGQTKGQGNKYVRIYDTDGTTVLCSHTMDYSAGHTFVGNVTVPSLKIKDSGNDHVITLDTASNESADRTLTIPALGGNKTLALVDLAQTFTAQQIFETGSTGTSPAIFRQTGGSAGTDEVQVGHTGSRGQVESKDGNLALIAVGAIPCISNGTTVASFAQFGNTLPEVTVWQYSGGGLRNWFGNGVLFADSGGPGSNTCLLAHANNSATGLGAGGPLYFDQVSDVGTPASNRAGLGAEDVAGTAELVATDEGGTETQLTSHRSDGPDWLYDDVNETGMLDKIDYHAQKRLGVIDWWNASRERRLRLKKLEPIEYSPDLTPEELKLCCGCIEAFASYNARTGKNKTVRTWEEDQARNAAVHEAARINAIEINAVNQAEWEQKVADAEAQHVAALAEYAKLPEAERAKTTAPVKRTFQKPVEVEVPAEYVAKPKPEWLARWEAKSVEVKP